MSHSARVCASPQQTHEVTRLQDEIVATRARLTTTLRGPNEHTALFALLNALQLHVHNLRLAIKSDLTQCAERVRHSSQELRVARLVVDAVVKRDYSQAGELQRVPRPTVEETCTQTRRMVFDHFPEAEEAFRHTSRSSLSPERAWKVLQARMSLLGTKLAQPPAKPDADSPTQEDLEAFRTRILRYMQLRMKMPSQALLGMTTCPLHLSRWAGVPPSEGASPDRLDRMDWEEGSWGEGYAHEVFRHGAVVDERLGPFCPHYCIPCPEYADTNPCTLLYGGFTVVSSLASHEASRTLMRALPKLFYTLFPFQLIHPFGFIASTWPRPRPLRVLVTPPTVHRCHRCHPSPVLTPHRCLRLCQ